MDKIKEIRKIVSKVDGFLSDNEGKLLYNLAKKCSGKGVIVEIGSWKGKSTIWLAKGSEQGHNAKIFAIDPHTGSSEHRKEFSKVWTFKEFKKNIRNAKVEDLVVPILKTSRDAARLWKKPVEILWIDGAHEYEAVLQDYELWEPHLIDGGIIAFHDTVSEKGPVKVVNEYLYNGMKFRSVGFVDGITFGQKCHKLSLGDKIRNSYVFFLRSIYIFISRFSLPKPIVSAGKRISSAM